MQLWKVKTGSVLCMIKDTTIPPRNNEVAMNATTDTLMMSYDGEQSRSIDYNWMAASKHLGGDLGVAIYSSKVSGAIVLKFSDLIPEGTYKYDWNDGLGAHKKITFGIKSGDIEVEGGNNSMIVFWLFAFTLLIYLVLSVYYKVYSLGAVAASIQTLSASILTGTVKLNNSLTLTAILLVIITVSSLAGAATIKLSRSAQAYVSIASSIALQIYLAIAGYNAYITFIVMIAIALIGYYFIDEESRLNVAL